MEEREATRKISQGEVSDKDKKVHEQESIPSSLGRPKGGAPIRTLELVRAKFDKVLGIDPLKQTFIADVFFEFKIRGGAHDADLTREGNGPPSQVFPQDTLRPSARWYLNQFDFANSCWFTMHKDTMAAVRGDDIHLRFRANGEFAEQLEMEEFPFDMQELTVKLIVHCIIGGFVGVEVVAPNFRDDFSDANGVRSIDRAQYAERAQQVIRAQAESIPSGSFKVDTFHLHNVWELSPDVTGAIDVHADEFPQMSITCNVRRRPEFYLWNVVVTMVLLEALSFGAYILDSLDIEGLSGRISLAFTLVLTCGFYRSSNSQFTPPVATMTLLDEYMLQTALIIGVSVAFHVVLAIERHLWLEPYLMGTQLIAMIAQHVYAFWRAQTSIATSEHLFRESTSAIGLSMPARLSKAESRIALLKRSGTVRIFSQEKGAYVELPDPERESASDAVAA
jgi:hypothetical protein